MSAFVPRSLAGPHTSAKRPLAVGAGVALAAAILFLARHVAPEAPAVLGFGLAALAGLAVIALAFTLEDEALARLTQAAAAGIGLIVVGALADPEARLRLCSSPSAAFGVSLAAWLARMGRRRPRVSFGQAALFAAALAGLSAYAAIARACVARSDDRRLHDLSRDRDHGRPIGRRGQVAAAHVGNRRIDCAGLFLGAGVGPWPRAGDRLANFARALHVRASCPLRRAGPACARDPGARSGASRRTAPLAITRAPHHCTLPDRHKSLRAYPSPRTGCGEQGRIDASSW